MNEEDLRAKQFEDALRDEGVRITRQRTALIEVLSESRDHPDADELHRRAREKDSSVSLATVYRTLAQLEEMGLVHRHVFAGEAARYETTDLPHHDHIINIETGTITEFRSGEIEKIQERIARELGLEIVHHRLELYCRPIRDSAPDEGAATPEEG
ncbi:MAG: Fur family transcriptional regulator [Pseudomonadota bacterium]